MTDLFSFNATVVLNKKQKKKSPICFPSVIDDMNRDREPR
jgi:hypothetical protein